MVVAKKMQSAVKNQPADFSRQRVTVRLRISTRRFRGDYDVPQEIRKLTTSNIGRMAARGSSRGFPQDGFARKNAWQWFEFLTIPCRPWERENIR